MAGQGALVHGDAGPAVMLGRRGEHLAPLLDGSLAEDEIVDRLEGLVPSWAIRIELRRLRSMGCLAMEDGRRAKSEPAAPRGAEFTDTALAETVPPVPVAAPVGAAGQETSGDQDPAAPLPSLAVSFAGELDSAVFLDELQSVGFGVQEPAGLKVVLADSYLRADLAEVNESRLGDGESWMLVRPGPRRIWIGPLLVPGRTGCWRCLRDRLARNRPEEAWMLGRRPGGDWLPGNRSPGESARTTAAVLCRWLSTGPVAELSGRLWEECVRTGVAVAHTVIRRPQCPACGVPDTLTERIPPSHGAVDLASLVDPLTGVVLQTIPLEPDLPGPFHACRSPWGGEPHGESLAALSGCLPRGMGKGWTADEARTRAIGEAVERYSAAFQGDESAITASAHELGEETIDPTECMLYSEAQYAARSERNIRLSGYHRIPERFDVRAPIAWTRVERLGGGGSRLLPTALLYSHCPPGPDGSMLVSDPNGTAAGRTPEEAILNGLLEVIERDALGIWWYNAVQRPEFRFDGPDPPWLSEARAAYRRIGRSFWFLDIGTDVEVPCVAAVSRRTDMQWEQVLFGFGAHLDPVLAVRRALLELNQLVTYVADARRTGRPFGTPFESWLRIASLADAPYLAPLPGESRGYPSRPPTDAPTTGGGGVDACLRLLEACGLDAYVADMTRADIGLPVFKAIVPGLRSMYARLAPGRLYDVPAAEGWLPVARDEATVDRFPFFL